jgi:hypothetical protein
LLAPVLLLALAALGRAAEPAAETESVSFRPYTRPVMTWVPPYQTRTSKTRLREATAERDPAAALTHVGLQFWTPGADGTVRRVKHYDKLTDDLIAEWRDWCHRRGVRALLCIYNGEERWDWPLAQAGFARNPEKFVNALVAEMELHALDGIDVDLEGNGDFPADKAPFVSFIERLSKELRTRKKQLFVDTFAYKWNAPNQTWWPELFPLVDGISSMGYEEIGARSTGWRGYPAQATAAGPNASKLLIGLPTHLDRWQESSALDHLEWFASNPMGPGVALWDAQMQGTAWKGPDAWRILKKVSAAR